MYIHTYMNIYNRRRSAQVAGGDGHCRANTLYVYLYMYIYTHLSISIHPSIYLSIYPYIAPPPPPQVLGRTEGAEQSEVDFKRAFWTATLGGAAAIGLEEHLGSFAVGKQFDALRVSSEGGVYDIFPEAQVGPSSLKTDFERFVNLGDDRNVRSVYVRGRLVRGDP